MYFIESKKKRKMKEKIYIYEQRVRESRKISLFSFNG